MHMSKFILTRISLLKTVEQSSGLLVADREESRVTTHVPLTSASTKLQAEETIFCASVPLFNILIIYATLWKAVYQALGKQY